MKNDKTTTENSRAEEVLDTAFCSILRGICDESKKKSDRVKLAVRKVEGKKTKSYKGNKWGRKSISTQAINKVLQLKKDNPKITMRQIAAQVTYAGKNNQTKNISASLVHKILTENSEKVSVKNLD